MILRGVDKADGELALVCLVHNVKKIYAGIMAKGGELDNLTGELQVVSKRSSFWTTS